MDDVATFLNSSPAFRKTATQFMMLHDAAAVLGELEPDIGGSATTVAEYLRQVGNNLVRRTGVPEAFLQAMIKARPDPYA